jgi:nicotinate-nucleotide adenylyltransferase
VIGLRLGVYGGSFNPPHLGHVKAAECALSRLALDRLVVVPAGIPPHKALPEGSPGPEDRLEMTRLSFSPLKNTAVSDIELKKDGVSYTVETLEQLQREYPGSDMYLIMGSDMFLTLEQWKDAGRILRLAKPAVLVRGAADDAGIAAYASMLREKYGAGCVLVDNDALEVSSSELRELLPRRGGVHMIEEKTYAHIIKKRLYGAKPDFDWLRSRVFERMLPGRIPHVKGCEAEAVKLARRYGADEDEAREAAILHDITKALTLEDQLQLCRNYDIMTDAVEQAEVKLLHSKTGAAIARDQFGVSDRVSNAICWHTTGREDMTLLEKIIYIADYIEPTRDFEGVDDLRRLAYTDLDQALVTGLQMSIDDMKSRGIVPHLRTQAAIKWLLEHSPQDKRG